MFKPLNKIVLGILMLSLFTACNSTTSTHISGNSTTANATAVVIDSTLTAIASATTTAPPFPAFSDWRAAYMDNNLVVHAVSFDGKIDITGPTLTQAANYTSSYPVYDNIAPDGHMFAYSFDKLAIIDLQTGTPVVIQSDAFTKFLAYNISWSHDSRYLALGDDIQSIGVIDATPQTFTTIPLHLAINQTFKLLGWIGASHIAIFTHVGDTNGQYVFESVSIPDGHQQIIASLAQSGWNGEVNTPTLSPDGSQILVSNIPFRNDPFTPHVAVISTSSGQVRYLPGIDQQTGAGFTTIAWQPGHPNNVDVSVGFNGDSWALNLQSDTATYLVKGWSPTKWSPDGNTLILSTDIPGEGLTQPISIEAMTFDSQGNIASQTVLTKQAYGFPFMGFIKTSGS